MPRSGRRKRPLTVQWPVTLRRGEVTLRPLESGDAKAWREVRVRNAAWLKPSDARSRPVPTAGRHRSGAGPSRLARDARRAVRGGRRRRVRRSVGQQHRPRIRAVRLGRLLAGPADGRPRIMPLAVAMVIDHCFLVAGLHRIESASARSTNSLRVVEKPAIHEVGYAPAVPAHRRGLAGPPPLLPRSPPKRAAPGLRPAPGITSVSHTYGHPAPPVR